MKYCSYDNSQKPKKLNDLRYVIFLNTVYLLLR